MVDFPLFEYSEEAKSLRREPSPLHVAAGRGRRQYLLSDPGRVKARAYDLVLNGNEIGGGSIRIHSSEVQAKVFQTLGISDADARSKFGFLLDALQFGAPPHGGIALGMDRLVMLLAGGGFAARRHSVPEDPEGHRLHDRGAGRGDRRPASGAARQEHGEEQRGVSEPSKVYDVLVIGGGVNGTGMARDVRMRGLSTALVEKRDFASGASGANSGMIHGGIRYLQTEPARSPSSPASTSGYIQKIAPHLLFRIPFIFPVARKGAEASLLERALALWRRGRLLEPTTTTSPTSAASPDAA